MAGIHFNITGDNSNFLKKLREAEEGVKNTSKQIEQSGMGIEDLFNRMTQAAAAFGAGFTAKELISNIMQVRGEFQQLEVAFNTMLGSEEKAMNLMNQLVQTATVTPFGLTEVANGAKQLLAYGTAAENVNDTLVRLGNIAAGLSQPMGDLVYLYGTTMTQGRLYTQDLNQFTGRGIPMIRELAKQFGVAESEVKKLVEAGKVGFPEVQKVIMSLTDEGGMFFNLMQEQSKTITGQISNIEDAIDTMLNKIGQSSEGIINESLSGASYLVENYEKVGQVLIGLVATYGAYRAAVMAVVALNNLRIAGIAALTIAERAHYGLLVLTTAAQKALNAAMLTNPFVLVTTAVVGLGAAMWAMADKTTAAEKALKRYNDAVEGINQKEDERKRKVEEAVRVLQSEVEAETTKVRALNTLKELYPDLADKYEREKRLAGDLTAEWKAYNEQTSIRVRQAKEARLAEIEQEISGKQTIYNVEERLGNRSAMKRIKSEISVLQKEAAKYRQDILASINLELEAEDNNKSATSNLYQKDLATAKEAWESAKKGYESLIKDQNATTEQVKEAKKLLDEKAAAYKDLGGDTTGKASQNALKQQEELNKEILALENDIQNSRIARMKEGREKRMAEIEQEYKDRKQQIEIERREAKADGTYAQKESLFNAAEEEALANRKQAEEEYDKQRNAEQLQMMYDYLKEYGNFQQQKLAIAEEYAQKIAEAQNAGDEWKVKSLQKERDSALASADANKIAMSIDWSQSFSAVGNVLSDIAKETLQKVEEYMTTSEFKNLAPESKKAYTDLASKLKENGTGESTSAFNFKIWGEVAEDVKAYQEAVRNVINAENTHSIAVNNLKNAQEKLAKATTVEERNIAQQGVDIAQGIAEATEQALNEANSEKDSSNKKLKDSSESAIKGLDDFTKALNEMSSGSLYGFANGLTKIIGSIAGNSEAAAKGLASLGKVGGIVGAILQVLEALGDDPAKFFEELLESVENAVYNIIADLPNVIGSIVVGVGNLIGGIFKGFGELFGFSNDKSKEKRIQEYQKHIDVLDENIENLEKRIEDAYSKDASELIEKENNNLKTQKVLIQQQIKEEENKKDTDHNRIKEWEEELERINERIEENKEKAVDAIFGEDLKSAIENFADAYANAWANGENKAKSAKDTVKKMMQQMVTESIKAAIQSSGKMEEIRRKLQEFYADNVLSGLEQDYIYKMADDLQKQLDEQFGWADGLMGGSAAQQEASSKGFESMSQETGEELNGRFTALQISNEEIKNQMIAAVIAIQSITAISSENNTVLNAILTQHVITNSHLEDVVKYTKLLNDIKSDISYIKINGVKTV